MESDSATNRANVAREKRFERRVKLKRKREKSPSDRPIVRRGCEYFFFILHIVVVDKFECWFCINNWYLMLFFSLSLSVYKCKAHMPESSNVNRNSVQPPILGTISLY